MSPPPAQSAGKEHQNELFISSLVPLIKGSEALDREALYWRYPHYGNQGGFPGGAIRMGDWKLLERFEDGRVHLYHLGGDLGEQHDVAAAHPQRVGMMRDKLHRWYQEVDAKFLQPKGASPDAPAPWRPSTGENSTGESE